MLVVFSRCVLASSLIFFFFNDTATTEIYTLSYTTLFRSLIGADGDRIHALADRPRRAKGRPRQRVAAGDDVVEEHGARSEEHTSELQSRLHLVCRLLLEKKKKIALRKTTPTRKALSITLE